MNWQMENNILYKFVHIFCQFSAALVLLSTKIKLCMWILSCLDVPLMARRNVETLHTAVLNWMSESETSVTPPITVKV